MPFPSFLFLLLATAAQPLVAQEKATPPTDPDEVVPGVPAVDQPVTEEALEGEVVVVTGTRLRGAVIGDIEPEITLSPQEIRGLGASNISELLEALAPQTRSGRGRGDGAPVTLVNGRRISGFAEIRDLPPEAIERVDILPEEVALKYGFRGDQRVVNFVLRPRFRAVTAELETGAPTGGGRFEGEADLNILRITQDGRWSLDGEGSRSTALFENERNIGVREGAPDERAFRTLLPATDRAELNGTYSTTILTDVSATANGELTWTRSESRFGLTGDDILAPRSALERDGVSRNARLATALNGFLGEDWRWSFTGSAQHNLSRSLTDLDEDAVVRDRARSAERIFDAEAVLNGNPFTLPAGEASATVKLGGTQRDFESRTTRGGGLASDLSRTRGEAQVNLDLPITEEDGFGGALGDLSLNANGAVEEVSDFGTLITYGAGLTWRPWEPLQLIASFTGEEGAPSVQQLGDPLIATEGVTVFDLVRGETAEITRLDGGNPDLLTDNRFAWKLGATLKPIEDEDLTFSLDYNDSRIRDVIAGFPTATPEIEAAFPDRFTRDGGGTLLAIDARPVNFSREDKSSLRTGVNFSKALGKPDPARAERFRALRRGARGEGGQGGGGFGRGGGGPRAEGGRGGGRGGFGGGGGRFGGAPGQGRLQVGLYHTVRLVDTALIRPGVPELDFLNGSAVNNDGGRSRHQVQANAGFFKNGLGVFAIANWFSATRVDGAAADGGGDLLFAPLTRINLRLFADLGQQEKLVARYDWLRGARVSLRVDNLLNGRLNVRNGLGDVPVGFERDRLDPAGRTVTVSFRKLFLPSRAARREQRRRERERQIVNGR